MNITVITLLYVWLMLELLFTIGCTGALLLRGSAASPTGGRMRLLWLAVLLLAMVPLRVFTPVTSVTICESYAVDSVSVSFAGKETPLHTESDKSVSAAAEQPAHADAPQESSVKLEIHLRSGAAPLVRGALTLFCCIWLVGAAAFLIYRLSERSCAAHMMRERSAPCGDGRMLYIYHACAARLGIRQPPPLRRFRDGVILSPCLCGLLHPAVYISDMQLNSPDDVLTMILTHELSHYRAGDHWLSLLAALAASLHWMNPLSRQMERAIAEDCEFACDANVLGVCGEECRLPYMHAILDIASGITAHTAGSAPFGGFYAARANQAEFLKRRYDSMKSRKSRRLSGIVSVCLTVVLLTTNMISTSSCAFTSQAAERHPVTLYNATLANAVAEYFGLADASELTVAHLAQITSLEIQSCSIPGCAAPFTDEDGATLFVPVRIRINEGSVWTENGYTASPVDFGGFYTDGYAVETLPVMLDAADYEQLLEAVTAGENGAWTAMKVSSFYCLADATDAVVEEAARQMLFQKLTDTAQVTLSHRFDVNGDGAVDEQDDVEAKKTIRLISEEQIVAELSEEEYKAELEALGDAFRAEVLAKYPFADVRPMYVLDPSLSEREGRQLVLMLWEAGLLADRALPDTEIDLRDTALMPNLKALTVSGAFTPVNLPDGAELASAN